MGGNFAVAQWHSVVGDIEANLDRAAILIAAAAAQGADVVVVPELFSTGYSFSLNVEEMAQPVPGPTSDCIAGLAAKHNVYIFGTILERDGDQVHNCGLFCSPDEGFVAKYRKVHLFGDEKNSCAPGNEVVVVDTRVGRLGLSICYDLCFPEFIRGTVLAGAEVVLNSTNWLTVGPPQDWDEWQWDWRKTRALAVARALENSAGLVMCCQGAGLCENIYSFGHSCVVSPSGRVLAELGEAEGVTTTEIPMGQQVESWRQIATYLPDRRVELYGRLLGYK